MVHTDMARAHIDITDVRGAEVLSDTADARTYIPPLSWRLRWPDEDAGWYAGMVDALSPDAAGITGEP